MMRDTRRIETHRPLRGAWLFIEVDSLSAAEMRMEGVAGLAARTKAMGSLMREYSRASVRLGQSRAGLAGVALWTQDRRIVAAYYGPGDLRNTRLDYWGYGFQHRLVADEVEPGKAQIHRPANDMSLDAYLPAAARGRNRVTPL